MCINVARGSSEVGWPAARIGEINNRYKIYFVCNEDVQNLAMMAAQFYKHTKLH